MRFMTSILMAFSILALAGCADVSDDGYLSPPGYGEPDLRAATDRAHRELLGATYLSVARDRDCREACDVFERGFDQARRLRLTSPAKCTDEFEDGLWSQTEYQEGCRAYTLKVIALVDRYKVERRSIDQG
jgi:hypothetical protein